MARTRVPSQQGAPTSNGGSTRAIAAVRPPGRRARVPEIVVGVLITAVFALGAVLWHLRAVAKVPALVAVSAIDRGEVVDSSDVRIAYVSSDGALARLDSSELNRVVGRVALVDLGEGTLFTPSMVAEATAIEAGDGVVGVALDPGAYPARGLAPGDRVNVVRTADAGDLDAEPSVIARNATVFAVEELSSDRLLVSILTSEGDAEAAAASAGAGGLRLVLVAP